MWDDLSPTNGGEIIINRKENSWITINFIDVPEFFNTGSNTFSITLRRNGTVDIVYGAVSAVDALVGVTEGGGALDPGETDLSEAVPLLAAGTTYEQFNGNPFDLVDTILKFRRSKNMTEGSLSLGDDDSQEIPLGFTFPYQGQEWTSVFVNSNGNLTFGAGSTDFSESVLDLLSGPPRIAALWDDPSPTNAGEIIINRKRNS